MDERLLEPNRDSAERLKKKGSTSNDWINHVQCPRQVFQFICGKREATEHNQATSIKYQMVLALY